MNENNHNKAVSMNARAAIFAEIAERLDDLSIEIAHLEAGHEEDPDDYFVSGLEIACEKYRIYSALLDSVEKV